jgi:uncharacterized protein
LILWTSILTKKIPMPVDILFTIGGESVPAELNDSDTAKEIIRKLPIDERFATWGDEIYFSIPVIMDEENAKSVVDMGELGYWPPGNAFCIFFGATPGSTQDHIMPASPVNPVGRVKADPKVFKKLAKKSNRIRVEKAPK